MQELESTYFHLLVKHSTGFTAFSIYLMSTIRSLSVPILAPYILRKLVTIELRIAKLTPWGRVSRCLIANFGLRVEVAIPIILPESLTTGPPLLPGWMAAVIWNILVSPNNPAIELILPLVKLIVFARTPWSGYPSTDISCPSSMGVCAKSRWCSDDWATTIRAISLLLSAAKMDPLPWPTTIISSHWSTTC